MKDNLYKRFKDYDFSDAKPVSAIPALKKLQMEYRGRASLSAAAAPSPPMFTTRRKPRGHVTSR